jgi:hypothetical protein
LQRYEKTTYLRWKIRSKEGKIASNGIKRADKSSQNQKYFISLHQTIKTNENENKSEK